MALKNTVSCAKKATIKLNAKHGCTCLGYTNTENEVSIFSVCTDDRNNSENSISVILSPENVLE